MIHRRVPRYSSKPRWLFVSRKVVRTGCRCKESLILSSNPSILLSSGGFFEFLHPLRFTISLRSRFPSSPDPCTRQRHVNPRIWAKAIMAAQRTSAMSSGIPILDFGQFLHGTDTEKREIATQIDEAFQNVGFVYLKNHGVPQQMVDKTFEWVSTMLERD
jgi:hypothetical protein